VKSQKCDLHGYPRPGEWSALIDTPSLSSIPITGSSCWPSAQACVSLLASSIETHFICEIFSFYWIGHSTNITAQLGWGGGTLGLESEVTWYNSQSGQKLHFSWQPHHFRIPELNPSLWDIRVQAESLTDVPWETLNPKESLGQSLQNSDSGQDTKEELSGY